MARYRIINRTIALLRLLRRKTAVRLNKIRPRFLGRVGVWDVLVFFYDAMTDRHFTLAAMGMAYRFFFALFPALILLFTLIPYIPVDNLQAETMDFLATVVPGDSLGFVERVVNEFFGRPSAGLITLNIVLVLFASLGGIKAMMYAFSKDSVLFRKRGFFRLNAVALLIFIVLISLFLFLLGLLVSGEVLVHFLLDKGIVNKGIVPVLLRGFYWLIVFAGLQVGASVLYYLGPETESRWKFFSPGSVLTGFLSLMAILAAQVFFANFANYNKIYGSLGAIMALMVWFYWLSVVLLVGFELNAAIAKAKFRMEKRIEAKKEEEVKEEMEEGEKRRNDRLQDSVDDKAAEEEESSA